jgi:hypothetical protein
LVPDTVTEVPTGPEVGLTLLRVAAVTTINGAPLLATLETVTTTLPVVAPLGTAATICVLPQLVGVALVPLKVTVLVPCVLPKFMPDMVTVFPTAPV